MAERSNLFEKLDEIKSGIDEIKPAQKMTEAEAIEFIKTAKRVFIYKGQKSEFNYALKSWRAKQIALIVCLAVSTVLYLLPLILYGADYLLWIAFAVVAALNIFQVAITISDLCDKNINRYEIQYNDFHVWTKKYYYDDNGIIYRVKLKLPLTILKILCIIGNYAIGIVLFFVFISQMKFAVVYFIIMFAFSLIIQMLLQISVLKGYALYFKDEDRIIPYHSLADFMIQHNFK